MLAILRKIDVRMGKAGADQREPADLRGRVARQLDELRGQGVMSDRQQEGRMLGKHLLPAGPSRGSLQ